MEFPTVRPNGASYIRPRSGEALDLTPPGFCWWRAAERGACRYRLVVTENAPEQPWVAPQALLDRVPAEHPRIFFRASQLDEVRETLYTT